jgi:hypothetical protein
MPLLNPNVMTAKANKSWFCARQEVEARKVFESELRGRGKCVYHPLSTNTKEPI